MTDCLFCKIVLGEVPAAIVYQDEDTIAFRDIEPQAPTHVLVIPRRHIAGLDELDETDIPLMGRLTHAATRVAELEGVATSGFRSVVNTGPNARQTVRHLHVHVLGGRLMDWPPG